MGKYLFFFFGEPFREVCWVTLKKRKKKMSKKNSPLKIMIFLNLKQKFFFFWETKQTKIIEFKQSDKHQFVIDKLLRFKSFKKEFVFEWKSENIQTQKEKISKKKKKKNLIHVDKYIFYLNSVTSWSFLSFLYIYIYIYFLLTQILLIIQLLFFFREVCWVTLKKRKKKNSPLKITIFF